MLTAVLVLIISLAILALWFRQSCRALVEANCDKLAPAGSPSGLNFPEIQALLSSGADLELLERAVGRDYEVLTYLFRHASGLALNTIEERLLIWDYQLMRLWYSVTKNAVPIQARKALHEMASIVGILAGRVEQRTGVLSEAQV